MVLVDGLVDRVAEGGPGAEAAGVHLADVDLGLAVDHPLGEVLAGAGALRDADRGADAHPVVAQAGGGAHEEAAVGGVGDGAGDGLLDAGLAEDGDALGGQFEPRHEDVVVGRGEVEVEVPVDAVGAVGDGVGPFVGADEEAVDLAAVVARRPGVADDGHLVFAGGHGGERLGDEVLVDQRDDRDVESDHGADLGSVVAGGVDDVVGHDPALVGDDLPAAVGQGVDVGDERVAGDGGAELAGAGGHGVGGAGGVGPSVVEGVEPEDDVGGVLDERGQFADLVGSDEVRLDADELEDALDVAVPLGLFCVDGEADGAAAVPAGGEAGLGFEGLVEVRGVEVDLGHVEAADEVRDESGGVPGGAGGEFALFDEEGVGPAFVGEVVEEAGAHGAASDDHALRLVAHGVPLFYSWVVGLFQ